MAARESSADAERKREREREKENLYEKKVPTYSCSPWQVKPRDKSHLG